MGTLAQDLRYAVRMLIKRPGFTAVAVLTLALGIGANSAIFSVVNAVLLRPLPFAEPDRLVYAEGGDLRDGSKAGSISPPDFLDYREQNHVFERLAAFMPMSFTVTGDGSASERVSAALVSHGFFETLGTMPLPGGRTFLAEEELDGRNTVAILSYGLWQRRYAGDPKIVGKTIAVNGETATIVGVMPQGFEYPREAQLWYPIPFKGPETSTRRFHFLRGVGLLKPGVTLAQAQADINSIARQLERQYPESNTNFSMGLTLLTEWTVGEMRPTLLILLAAVGFVLLIACANVANLSLARGASRAREVAIRSALGASRGRVVRQLLTESVVTALVGGALGLLLAMWGVDLLVSLSPENLPRVKEVTTDWRVLGFTLVVSVLTGVMFGLFPALATSKTNLTETLKEGGRGAAGAGRQRLRGLLVVAEVALSLVLLVGAGLLVKSFLRLSSVDVGFVPTNVLSMQLSLPPTNYSDPRRRANFYDQLAGRLESLPGVQAAGTVSELPLSGQENDTFFNIEGKPAAAFGSTENDANIRGISPAYFHALGVPLVKGRFFEQRDNMDSPKVVIVNDSFVKRYLPGEEALGKHLIIDYGPEPFKAEIVGVVGGIRHSSLAQAEPSAEMYVSVLQAPSFRTNLVVRAAGDPVQLTAAIRSEVQALDKDLPIYNVKTMEQHISASAAQPRFRTLLLGIFACVALVLAGIGIYGVISYSVTQRTHEIGLRVALGAQRGDVLRLVVWQGMRMALVGICLGVAGAFVVTRVMSSFLFGVSATDSLTFVGVSLLLAVVSFLACYLPARRATKVDPMVALRYE
ncbi:MAG TPA: ABC transporter permease [Pyrinomonadaceae bacterium]|nr:ABC transporter permease [Pyrinomonadaceae bacterium]